jgi:uncharacterized glyoxalase superfamily protein PhnB
LDHLCVKEGSMAVKPIPDGYTSVTPYLTVKGVETLLDFVKKAFDADETVRMARADGTIGHAEVAIAGSVVMMGEASGEFPPMPGMIHLYVDDCDATYQRALASGATSMQEPADQFYGDRTAGVRDPSGNVWWIAKHVEDIPEDEMSKRAQEWAQKTPGS